MSIGPPGLPEEYRAVLREYLVRGGEELLQRAYALGRRALASGTGILEMSTLHHRVAHELFLEAGASDETLRLHAATLAFFVESLSPHEMALRTSREASEAWRQLNDRLETEAKRIAHALHDEAGQLLAAVHLSLAQITAGVPPRQRRLLRETQDLLLQVEEQLRRISHELRPTILDHLGLVPALEQLAQGVSTRGGLLVEVEGPRDDRLPAPIENVLYRVVQEALTNVGRHARASRATVRLDRNDGEVLCVIRDDGIGFEPARAHVAGNGGGLGLIGMKERLSFLGGSLSVASGPGRGTEISIRIPLGDRDAASNPARG